MQVGVKHNPKNEMTARKSHDFSFLVKRNMIFPFYATVLTSKSCFNHKLCKRKIQSKNRNDSRKIARFCPVNHVLIAIFTSVKRNPKTIMTAGKSKFFSAKIFHDFLYSCTFLPSKSRFNRKLCKRKTQSNNLK